jgi:hypothetical protein
VLDVICHRPDETDEQYRGRRIEFIERQLAAAPIARSGYWVDWRREREATLARLKSELAALRATATTTSQAAQS